MASFGITKAGPLVNLRTSSNAEPNQTAHGASNAFNVGLDGRLKASAQMQLKHANVSKEELAQLHR